MSERLLYPMEEVAKRLSIGRSYAYELVASGELESVKVGRLRRVPAAALDAYVERLRGIAA